MNGRIKHGEVSNMVWRNDGKYIERFFSSADNNRGNSKNVSSKEQCLEKQN